MLAFALVVLISYKVDLGLAMLIGSIILGIFSMPISDVLWVIYETLISFLTFELVITIVLIGFLAGCLQVFGLINALAESLDGVIRDKRLVLAVAPAVFGFLPVYGGALMSAPVVDARGDKLGLTGEKKAFINLWFRHIVFFVYPLGPGLILLAGLANVSVFDIIPYQFPAFLSSIIIGYLISLRRLRRSDNRVSHRSIASLWRFVAAFSPILIIMALNLWFKVNLVISVIIGIALAYLIGRGKPSDLIRVAKTARLWKLALATLGVVIFSNMVKASNLAILVTTFMQGYSVSNYVLLVLIPLVAGVLTGGELSAVGISAPLLIIGHTGLSIPALGLLQISASLGYIISPLHLCLILTSEYFKTKTTKFYPKLLLSAVIVLITSLAVAIIFG